ncbi:MAG TPA: 4-hydroxythreonine-4-phosphate dehydrogenase PdxA [Dehalococcoidia bacterium]|nr:4-hydroxythreonine-4-phosphate dehydrogenase PdxA [Dehalococcoidia bacterium]
MQEKAAIGITIGDPAGIGPEVVTKALATGEVHELCRPVLIGNAWAIEQAVKLIGAPLTVRKVDSPDGAGTDTKVIDVIDPGNLRNEDIKLAQASAACGKAVSEWLKEAERLVTAGKVAGTVMAPINSDSLRMAGARAGNGASQGYLFLLNGPLRVVHLTDHLPVREAYKLATKDNLLKLVDLLHKSLSEWGIPNARIGVAGVNPHAMGEEDDNELKPAVEEAKKRGIDIAGPIPPDTVFRHCVEGIYDVVIAIFHDQGHVAMKTWRFEGTVAISLGRPYIGTSVAHGTAFDIVGKGIADHTAILNAMKMTASLATGRGFPRN